MGLGKVDRDLLRRLPDGTVKQRNPFTGTRVWTVPGRGIRPLQSQLEHQSPIDPDQDGRHCAFCQQRYLETPPEKARVIRGAEGWESLQQVQAQQLFDTVAEFRRIPNLFEILSFDYWQLNYGVELSAKAAAARERYLAQAAGLQHVLSVVEMKMKAAGKTLQEIGSLSVAEKLELSSGFFGGGHDVIVARRHFIDAATDSSQLASSGTLSVDEHRHFIKFSIDSAKDLYDSNPQARYVSVFQNWLRPAGASFDHLHKQLVAIDEHGTSQDQTQGAQEYQPNLFNEVGPNFAVKHGLMIAENDFAVAYAGYGHRYPAIEIFSRSECSWPWEQSAEEVAGMSDLLHAVHAATGSGVPCNEEWHYRPIDAPLPSPWRILLKWRVSTLAGFEGATKIYLNTIAPDSVREYAIRALLELRDRGKIAKVRIGEECRCEPNPLRYCR